MHKRIGATHIRDSIPLCGRHLGKRKVREAQVRDGRTTETSEVRLASPSLCPQDGDTAQHDCWQNSRQALGVGGEGVGYNRTVQQISPARCGGTDEGKEEKRMANLFLEESDSGRQEAGPLRVPLKRFPPPYT
ncbi:hypothetical protein C0Q70_02800 [Pomacea canaliculata]|uniref:Uncharacterized protein n=1 Tax=Pomacea canaliculata TaxID=400727 RepID=A0A2T7PQX6_POMCA|nr:hypothetical protein C0Q70_02800 [Pomacea canaliculata]